LAIALLAAFALIVAANPLMRRHSHDGWTAVITDPSMIAIRNMVARGNLSQAATRLDTT
jgi:hypothetical protein